MASGFIVRKKSELSVDSVVGNKQILLINDENGKGEDIKDIDQGVKKDINQITTDLLKNIHSATWNATMKMINDKMSVENAFTDKFFLVGKVGKKSKDTVQNNTKKVLICLTNGLDAYRRIKYDKYVGFNDITSRYRSIQSYISGDIENDEGELLTITNNVFNIVYDKTDIKKTIKDLKSIYADTVGFLNPPSAPPEDPEAVASGLVPQTTYSIETIEVIGIRYPLSSILGPAK